MRLPRFAALVVASAVVLGAGEGGLDKEERNGLSLTTGEEGAALVEWFAYQIGKGVEFSFFCIALQGADPSVEFLEQLRSYPYKGEREVQVVPDSACTQGEAAFEGVRHLETGEMAVVLFVSELHWVGANTVELRGGYYASGRSAMSATFTIRRRDADACWSVLGAKSRVWS